MIYVIQLLTMAAMAHISYKETKHHTEIDAVIDGKTLLLRCSYI